MRSLGAWAGCHADGQRCGFTWLQCLGVIGSGEEAKMREYDWLLTSGVDWGRRRKGGGEGGGGERERRRE